MFLGQAQQDKFVLNILKEKRNGYFLEIGSNHPININNTYLLETKYDWKGIMIEYNKSFLDLYKIHRPNSIHIMNDATTIDYKDVFEKTIKAPDYRRSFFLGFFQLSSPISFKHLGSTGREGPLYDPRRSAHHLEFMDSCAICKAS